MKLSFFFSYSIRRRSYGRAARPNITTWMKTCTFSSRCSPRRPRPTPGWVTLWRRSRSFSYQCVPLSLHARAHTHTAIVLRLSFFLLLLNLFALLLLFGPGQLILSLFTVNPERNSRDTTCSFYSLSVCNLHWNPVRAVGVCIWVCIWVCVCVCVCAWFWLKTVDITQNEKEHRRGLCPVSAKPWLSGSGRQHGAYLLFLHSLWMISPTLRAMTTYISSLIIYPPPTPPLHVTSSHLLP